MTLGVCSSRRSGSDPDFLGSGTWHLKVSFFPHNVHLEFQSKIVIISVLIRRFHRLNGPDLLPFVCSLQRTSRARTEPRPRSPCCSGHIEHILATMRPPRWSHRASDHTHIDRQTCTHCDFVFKEDNVIMFPTEFSSDLPVTSSGIFESAAQAVNSVNDELPGEVVLHSSADIRLNIC